MKLNQIWIFCSLFSLPEVNGKENVVNKYSKLSDVCSLQQIYLIFVIGILFIAAKLLHRCWDFLQLWNIFQIIFKMLWIYQSSNNDNVFIKLRKVLTTKPNLNEDMLQNAYFYKLKMAFILKFFHQMLEGCPMPMQLASKMRMCGIWTRIKNVKEWLPRIKWWILD